MVCRPSKIGRGASVGEKKGVGLRLIIWVGPDHVGDDECHGGEHTDRPEGEAAKAREATVADEESRDRDRKTAHQRAHRLNREGNAPAFSVCREPCPHQIREGRIEDPLTNVSREESPEELPACRVRTPPRKLIGKFARFL